MKKLLLTAVAILTTICTYAQFSVLTTVTSVEDEAGESTYSVTDKIGAGYDVSDKLMVGITMDGEDSYELLGRYSIKNDIWATCIYNYEKDSEAELKDKLDLGIGYSYNIWNNLYIDPNYTMPVKEDENGEREGSFNLSISYNF
jgi:opacity protein-like surface antigen